ncbi:oligopeptide transport system substrate-binding protein [Peribacillus deserti]|uniref:Oligopeptide transport system substrate-binding protein n=1 Tax=Peribacillus deserti TaxID=673318 RepID=A0ABS2QLE1_9BACI|nr:peptide ABC transporter substrate-binding protein [Peribacillus deserti]MBM7693927.1 oligopeptide transport system substrate-binding protein [Peribacillus deserti]
MKKKFSFLLVLVLALSTFLAACSGGDTTSTKPTGDKDGDKPAAAPKEQVLNLVAGSEIPSMDSTLATDSVSFNVMNNVYEGLYRLGQDNEPTLGMAAEEPKVSEDGKTYTFKLRDAKWSNGDDVTANDFVFSWRRAVDPATAAEYAYMLYDVKGAEEINTGKAKPDTLGIKAIDEKTLEITLKNNIPYFKSLLSFATFFPQNEKFFKEQGKNYALEANTGVYNGPFTLSEWKHEQSFQLKKNPTYWDNAAVKLETINFNIVKDTATSVNLYETKKADRVGLNAEFVDKYKSDSNYGTSEDTAVYFLRLNEKNKVLANKDARKALDMAWDKKSFVDVILNNGSKPAYFLVPGKFTVGPDGKDFRETNGDLGKLDVEEAKKLWAKAKKEAKFDKVTLELLNYDDDNSAKVSQYLKEQLETNLEGLTVNIKPQPFKQKLDLESKGNYDFSFAGWGPDYQDPMTFIDMFVTDGAHNQMGYSNPEYDKLVADAKGPLLTDLDARWKALLEAEKILMDDAAISPMYQRGTAFLQREYVKGIVEHPFGGDFGYKWAHIE